MSTRLRVEYDSVRSIIGNMKDYESEVEEIYDEMDNTVKSLVNNGYMEAESANAYVSEFEELLGPDIKKLSQLIQSFYKQLDDICNNFEEADAKIADMLK
jgi:WXG100 family type VII secretion target